MRSKFILYGICFATIFVLTSSVALGSINVKHEVQYDSYGDLSNYLGEEVYVSVTIEPGNNPVTDMNIKISSGDEALVDYSSKSFEESSTPAASVNLQKKESTTGRTYICEKLEPGQTLSLKFRAYPKTIMQDEIEVSKIRISYTQLGEKLHAEQIVNVDTSNSSWHAYTDAQTFIDESEEKLQTAQTYKFFGIAMGALIAFLIIIFIVWKRRQ